MCEKKAGTPEANNRFTAMYHDLTSMAGSMMYRYWPAPMLSVQFTAMIHNVDLGWPIPYSVSRSARDISCLGIHVT